MKKLVTILFAALFPLVSSAEVPEWYPEGEFKRSGYIKQIDLKARVIIVADRMAALSDRVKAHSPTEEFYPLSKIKVGQFVGLDYIRDDNGKILITEIWVVDETIIPELPQAGNVSDSTSNSAPGGTMEDDMDNIKGKGSSGVGGLGIKR